MRISDWSSDVCSSDLPCKSCLPVLRSYSRHLPSTISRAITDNELNGIEVNDQLETLTLIAGREAFQTLTESSRRVRPQSSSERSVGNECDCTCRSRWSPLHYNIKYCF